MLFRSSVAVYMLRSVRTVLHGSMPDKWKNATDANLWRKLPYALLLASLLAFGFFPRLLTDKITPAAEKIVNLVKPEGASLAVIERK